MRTIYCEEKYDADLTYYRHLLAYFLLGLFVSHEPLIWVDVHSWFDDT